jgi:antitoxin MazE
MYAILQKWGNSSAIRIPKSVLDMLRLNANDKLELIADDRQIILRPAKYKPRLEELFSAWDGGLPEAYDWGELEAPEGRELI